MRNIFLVALLCLGFTVASAQEVYTSSGKSSWHRKKDKGGYDPDRLILGGGIIASFSNGYIAAGATPIVGYRLTKSLSAGVGLGYLYEQYPDDYFSTPSKTYYDRMHMISPSLWSRFFVWNNVFLSGRYEYDIIRLTAPGYDHFGNQTTLKANVNSNNILLGLGLRQPIGGRVSIFAEIQHEFLQEKYSPYLGQAVIFNVGICAGL